MKSFLQSKQWADFQELLGHKIWRVDDVLLIKHNLPLKRNYLYSPHCGENFLSESFLDKVREIAKKEKSMFLKVEPAFVPNLSELRRGKKSHSIQPRKTLILDTTKSEQELLERMHSKTRYNIRLAEKKNIKIKKDKKYFEDFWRLIQKITKRDGFHHHSKEHYEKLLKIPGTELFVVLYKDKIIAANIVLFYSKTAVYLHGASDYNYRSLMAPFLLQWQQILEAKKRGCNEYDFWGIDEKKWPGVTRFKRGFNGKEIEYVGAYDYVFKPLWYFIYKIARRVL